MKDILVHYTSQERDEDTGLYTDVVYKGYIQHWHCNGHNPKYRRQVP